MVYKGYLNHLVVAIKILHSDDKSSTKHFNQELEVLGGIRHPHLLMLLGACPDMGCLMYEYMENGSLADRLQRIDGTPPLPLFHRFRIAWEIASALVFLHSTKPSRIIHRDLKPENVLLDGNLVSKIGDVGLSTLVPLNESLSSRTMYKNTDLAGTLFYIDPGYQRTGRVSVKSDTYALGMVILQLLTARPPIGLPELVERALEDGQLTNVLDESAGEWPVKEAYDLAQLGLTCLEMRSKNRLDLKSMVMVDSLDNPHRNLDNYGPFSPIRNISSALVNDSSMHNDKSSSAMGDSHTAISSEMVASLGSKDPSQRLDSNSKDALRQRCTFNVTYSRRRTESQFSNAHQHNSRVTDLGCRISSCIQKRRNGFRTDYAAMARGIEFSRFIISDPAAKPPRPPRAKASVKAPSFLSTSNRMEGIQNLEVPKTLQEHIQQAMVNSSEVVPELPLSLIQSIGTDFCGIPPGEVSEEELRKIMHDAPDADDSNKNA